MLNQRLLEVPSQTSESDLQRLVLQEEDFIQHELSDLLVLAVKLKEESEITKSKHVLQLRVETFKLKAELESFLSQEFNKSLEDLDRFWATVLKLKRDLQTASFANADDQQKLSDLLAMIEGLEKVKKSAEDISKKASTMGHDKAFDLKLAADNLMAEVDRIRVMGANSTTDVNNVKNNCERLKTIFDHMRVEEEGEAQRVFQRKLRSEASIISDRLDYLQQDISKLPTDQHPNLVQMLSLARTLLLSFSISGFSVSSQEDLVIAKQHLANIEVYLAKVKQEEIQRKEDKLAELKRRETEQIRSEFDRVRAEIDKLIKGLVGCYLPRAEDVRTKALQLEEECKRLSEKAEVLAVGELDKVLEFHQRLKIAADGVHREELQRIRSEELEKARVEAEKVRVESRAKLSREIEAARKSENERVYTEMQRNRLTLENIRVEGDSMMFQGGRYLVSSAEKVLKEMDKQVPHSPDLPRSGETIMDLREEIQAIKFSADEASVLDLQLKQMSELDRVRRDEHDKLRVYLENQKKQDKFRVNKEVEAIEKALRLTQASIETSKAREVTQMKGEVQSLIDSVERIKIDGIFQADLDRIKNSLENLRIEKRELGETRARKSNEGFSRKFHEVPSEARQTT